MRREIQLNGADWQLGAVSQKPFRDENDLSQVQEWLPAQVPGDVRLDLLRAGKVADSFYGTNNAGSQWVDSRDWWYTRPVNLEIRNGERAFLIFEGIDYQSAVFWNGTPLGRHAGMFSRQVYELPRGAATLQRSELAVRIWGSDALPKMQLSRGQRLWKRLIAPLFPSMFAPFADRYATLKCQMQFGWDFAPRLRTAGIWDDASIVVVDSVFIEDAWVKTLAIDQAAQKARVQVRLALDSDRAQPATVSVTVRGKNFQSEPQTATFETSLAQGKQSREFEFELSLVRLWNPWDRGDPNLYEVGCQVAGAGTQQPFDSMSVTYGVRSIELALPRSASRDAEPWTFVVNGKREFIRGANWVPNDAIPGRLTDGDYSTRLGQVRDANINFLRVWGGGLREKRAFYDICDELGILVWQEFPFAGAVLDRFPSDGPFLQMVREECGAIVRSLRSHPSLAVWCGGNEFNTRGNRAIVETLREVVANEDGTRPFKPASPYRDESHYWRVWHRSANLRDYRKCGSPFLSEFGLQSAPTVASLNRFLPKQALWPPGEMWTYHSAELNKLWRYARSINVAIDSVGEFVDVTQRAQAYGLQIAIEHMRRRKGEASGVAVWQFNDAWPAISWSLVDYYGNPKRAYTELQKLYSPVLASFDYPLEPRRPGDTVHGDLWLINDLGREFESAQLDAYLDESKIYARQVHLAADSAARIEGLDVRLGEGENRLRLELQAEGQVLSDHCYDLNFCDAGEINPLVALAYSFYDRLMR